MKALIVAGYVALVGIAGAALYRVATAPEPRTVRQFSDDELKQITSCETVDWSGVSDWNFYPDAE